MNSFFTYIVGLLLPVLLLSGLEGRSQNIPPQYADTLAKLKAASPQQRAQMQNDLMKTKLGLTGKQYEQVSAINLAYAWKMEPILRSDAGRFSRYRQVKPLLEEKDGKLKAVFTAGQWKTYQDVKKEMIDQAKKAMAN